MNERKNDPVNNPKHYTDGCSVECIDMMQTAIGWDGVIYFCLGNAYKYLWRHQLKNNPEEDLAKAKWYIDRAVVMAQDDKEDYGYLLSMAEPLMRLIETYTILYQSKKAMDDHKIDIVNFEANFDNNTERRDLLSDLIDTKRILNSSYGSKLFDTEETKSDHDCMDEDDWAFVSADVKIIYNRLTSKEARDGHVTGVDRSVVIKALDRIFERCKKHQKEDKYEL